MEENDLKTRKKINIRQFIKLNSTYISVVLLCVVLIMAAGLFNWDSINSYTAYNTETRSFVKAKVVSVDLEKLEKDSSDSSRYLGEQEITVRILEGEMKGQLVSIDNYLSQTHNIFVKENQKIIVCADMPEDVRPYFTVYNYDRCLPLGILVVVFVFVMLFVGKGKGLRALLGVTFTLLAVVLFMVQAMYHGFSPVVAALITVLISTAISLLLLNGLTKKTAAAAAATFTGICATGIIFFIFSKLLNLSGFNTDNVEELLLIGSSTGLPIKNILLAGVLISALGAVMDVAVSLAAALFELLAVNPSLSGKSIMNSGLNIGKDMIGTMSNTLILAFAGSSINTMLTLMAYGADGTQLLNSDYLAIELSQGLCATIGVILTVPITAGICAWIYTNKYYRFQYKK